MCEQLVSICCLLRPLVANLVKLKWQRATRPQGYKADERPYRPLAVVVVVSLVASCCHPWPGFV